MGLRPCMAIAQRRRVCPPVAGENLVQTRIQRKTVTVSEHADKSYDKRNEDPAHREQSIRERAYRTWESEAAPKDGESSTGIGRRS